MAESLNILSSKLRRALAQLPYLPRALALVWVAAGRWSVAWAAVLVAQGLLPVANVYLIKLVVDRLAPVLGGDSAGQNFQALLLLVALVAAVMLLAELLRGISGWIRTAQSELVQDHVSRIIHQQSVSVDLAFYESPEYFDQLHRARGEASYRPVALLESMGGLLQNAITLAGMLVVLVPFGGGLITALLASALPPLYVVLKHNLLQHHWRRRITADERRAWYYDWLMTGGETAAELRLFGLGDHFQSAYQNLRSRLRRERLALAKNQSLADLAATTISLLIIACALAWIVWQTANGVVSLGTLILFYQAVIQGQRTMRSALDNVGQIYTNSLFLSNLFEFLALKPTVIDPSCPATPPRTLLEGIGFRRVTFSYPGSERKALENFNLDIRADQFVAIVGMNGAGKSTLVKLLCRLYDPEAGRIELDRIDLREMPIAELRRMVSVLFQEPVHYSATVAENITIGDLERVGEAEVVRAAAEAAGADDCINRLPKGYENLLGKWFDGGAELSVGEWQRIALARAFLRQCPIIILDEPTSAMDPWSEADWLERFRQLAAGRTVILITHRLTTAMHADVIHVMADGQIVESGRHNELINSGGLYAQSWVSQMKLETTLAEAV